MRNEREWAYPQAHCCTVLQLLYSETEDLRSYELPLKDSQLECRGTSIRRHVAQHDSCPKFPPEGLLLSRLKKSLARSSTTTAAQSSAPAAECALRGLGSSAKAEPLVVASEAPPAPAAPPPLRSPSAASTTSRRPFPHDHCDESDNFGFRSPSEGSKSGSSISCRGQSCSSSEEEKIKA